MKKSWLVLVAAIGVAGVGLYLVTRPEGLEIGALSLGGQDKAYLRARTVDFLEDLQFKDFQRSGSYHLVGTQQKQDIPALIHRAFLLKNEVLDVQSYEILEVDLDRSGQRARVRAMIYYRILGDQDVRDKAEAKRSLEMLFYWFKQPEGSWAMELESSLRSISPQRGG